MFTIKFSFIQALALTSRARLGRKKLDNNTYMTYNGTMDQIEIKLHGNTILSINRDDSFRASHCGWTTRTTKDRLNSYTNLGLYQKKGQWYLAQGLEFVSGSTFNAEIESNPVKYGA
jgi:hypothetical protein